MMKQLLCFDAKQSHRTGSYWCVKFRGSIQPHLLPVCKGQKWADVVLPKGNKNTFQPFQLQTFSGVFARRQWSSKWPPVWQFVNSWNWWWISPGLQLDFWNDAGFSATGSTESTCDPFTFFQGPAVPFVTLLFLFCDYLVILSLLLNNGWRLGVLPFWRFPWLRSDSCIEMQHALGQQAKSPAAAHTFLFVQEQHMLNLSHSLGPFGPLWGDATLATLFWAVIQRFGVHQDSHLWKVDKKQRERCRRNGPPQSWSDGGKLSSLLGVLMDVHSKLGTGTPSNVGWHDWF